MSKVRAHQGIFDFLKTSIICAGKKIRVNVDVAPDTIQKIQEKTLATFSFVILLFLL